MRCPWRARYNPRRRFDDPGNEEVPKRFSKGGELCHSCAKSFTRPATHYSGKSLFDATTFDQNADWRCTCARRTDELARIWQLNDDALARVIVISDVHSRSKLAGRLIPLFASLRGCLLVLVASFFSTIPAQASNVSLPTTGHRLDFAIADFDGDGRPNLATIEPGSNSPSQSIYRIQVQLGDGGVRSVDLVALSGGLRIAADDVNGDGIPDLIVSLAWREGPVAVLLNDGHASFSLADSSSFPGVSGGSGKTLNGEELPPPTDTVATPPKLPVGDFSGWKYLLHARRETDFLPRANFARISNLLLVSLLGRAPPTPSCE